MIDYRYKTFSVLADTLNYTKTAKLLNLSQPAVTKHIQYLESHLNTELVSFENRKLTLTKKGQYLKTEMDRFIQETEFLKEHLAENPIQKSLLVGASRTIGEYFITDKLQQFTLQENDSEIDLVIDNTKNLLVLLNNGDLDVALISGPFNKELYETQIFFEGLIVAVCSPDNPIAQSKNILFSDLENEKLLLREKGSGINSSLQETLSEKGLSLDIFSKRTIIGNIHLMKELIKKDEGIGFFYYISVTDEIIDQTLQIIPISDLSFSQSFYLVFNKNTPPNKLRENFLQLFNEEVRNEANKNSSS
ncbi:LysR family transcriptional regulator [Jeotgalibaca sp. MA1X17-3]|uniref:LysR family transcriptional regulator n=1 Tax=Jeotgalibaca sp. MA1X17-3 TaxID=2908211 RepID=UPI001F4743E0|nr:LysR family transcriptional regulator [Jeotgalibaca sp. MA1X17-3]UJF16372.1 LysR family transcriptional regulator [Jeotgalibaca sp. MA1X17-3]